MKTVRELVNESISESAIQHKIAFAKRWGIDEDVEFYSNLTANMLQIIESKVSELRVHGDNSIDITGKVLSIHDPFIIRTKAMYAAFSVFKNELMNSNGQILYPDTGWSKVGKGDIPWQNVILKECHKDEIYFERITATGNHWDYETNRREAKTFDVFRLRTKDNCWITFESPQEGCNVIFVKMFKTPKEKRRNSFYTLNRFRRFFQILTEVPEIHTLRSPCLAGPEAEDDPKKDSWRFKKMNLGGRHQDTFALMVFWQRLGGCNIRIEGENIDELYFMKFKVAMEIKEMFLEENKENPFKLLSPFSIYTREQYKLLNA
tara:strand:+ start:4935 stop:5891 length:957 start_codon:yes stop_codon:yes gene_type:complete